MVFILYLSLVFKSGFRVKPSSLIFGAPYNMDHIRRDRVKIFRFFFISVLSISHSSGSYESTGTKIFKKSIKCWSKGFAKNFVRIYYISNINGIHTKKSILKNAFKSTMCRGHSMILTFHMSAQSKGQELCDIDRE